MFIDYNDNGEPKHWLNIVVFILVVMAVVFLISRNQPTWVGDEEVDSAKLQIVEGGMIEP